MKIGLVTSYMPPHLGGIEQIAESLFQGYAAHGWRCVHDYPGPERHVRPGYDEMRLGELLAHQSLVLERHQYYFRFLTRLATDLVSALHLLYQRFGRFLGVGLSCAVLHNVVMICGDLAGWHYVVSSIVSLLVVTVFGYLLHTRWTFPDAARGGEAFRRYALTVSANYPLSLAGMFVLVDLLGVPVVAAAPAVTVALLVFNYVANRWALRVKRGRA